jgi:hypothetical protein
MRKHYLRILATFFLLSTNALHSWDMFAEGKAAYYYPIDKNFRHIYEGNGIYGAELTAILNECVWLWGSVDYFTDQGEKIPHQSRTRITLVPISFGIKFGFPIAGNCKFYIGGGLSRIKVEINDHSPFLRKHSEYWDWGGVGKAGFLLPLCKDLYADIFTNFSFQQKRFKERNRGIYKHRSDMHGLIFGVGLGWHFGPYSQTYCLR